MRHEPPADQRRHGLLRRPSRQEELLLRAALAADDRAREAWLAVARGLDLASLEPETHAVLPLVAARLPVLGFRYAHQPRLDGVRRRTWYLNATRMRAVTGTVHALERAGLSPVATGGLAVLLHGGDLSLRRLADAELALPRQHRGVARHVMAELGGAVRSSRRDGAMLDLYADEWATALGDVTLRYGDDEWPYPDAAPTPSASADYDVLVQRPADTLAYTIADCPNMPGYSAVRLFADVVQLTRLVTSTDWDLFIAATRRRHAAVIAPEALAYAREELDAEVPREVLRQLQMLPTRGADRFAAKVAPRSALAAALVRRSDLGRPRDSVVSASALLQEVWDLRSPAALPVEGLRRFRRRLSGSA